VSQHKVCGRSQRRQHMARIFTLPILFGLGLAWAAVTPEDASLKPLSDPCERHPARWPGDSCEDNEKPEVTKRTAELRAWSISTGDDNSGVEALMGHPALRDTLNNAINVQANGSRWEAQDWGQHCDEVYKVHNQQTSDSRAALVQRWSNNVTFGNVSMWDLLKLLHFTIDNTDAHLMYTSQFIHCLQVYRAVKKASVTDGRFKQDADYTNDMMIGALVHDLGKSLSVLGEADGNVDCMNRVTKYGEGGLDDVDFQYNHDRYGHDKLLANVNVGRLSLPKRVLDIAKFHSLRELGAMHSTVQQVYQRTVASAQQREAVRVRGLLTLVDGDVVSTEEQTKFREHVSSNEDIERAAFVLHFAEFDLHSKDRTDIIPTDVDIGEIKALLQSYMVDKGSDTARLLVQW